MGAHNNFVDHCRALAAERPDRVAFTWLENGEQAGRSLTFAQLDELARLAASALQERGLAGHCALLFYPPGLEFITGFLGCLYAGVVAVPMSAPRNERAAAAIQGIASHAQASILLTSRENLENPWLHHGVLATLPILATDLLEAGASPAWKDTGTQAEQLAFVQYTSGSTGTPKGVQVSHRNLIANERMIRASFGTGDDTVFVSWLPLFHDMGLIGNVLHPLWLGVQSVLMAPSAFVQKPVRWLRAIDRYRGTTTGGPNFGYELCVQRVREEQLAGLDLSSLKVAYNGSEPVRAATLEEFSRKFASAGFRPSMFLPCYGMAEASLFVSGGLDSQPWVTLDVSRAALKQSRVHVLPSADRATATTRLVGCGRSWHSQRILIVDPKTRTPLHDGQVGEIWLQGDNLSRGYRAFPADEADPFDARLADGEGPFLRTGDLGFLWDAELFVTGRLKDLLIVRGRNYYPQDLELLAGRAHDALRPEFSAAFVLEAEQQDVDAPQTGAPQQVVIVQEVHREHAKPLQRPGPAGSAMRQELTGAIRSAIAGTYDIHVARVVFVRHATLPKTSSGKVQRRKCRDLLLSGKLHELVPISVRRQAASSPP